MEKFTTQVYPDAVNPAHLWAGCKAPLVLNVLVGYVSQCLSEAHKLS